MKTVAEAFLYVSAAILIFSGTQEWAISAMTGGNAWRYERSSSEKSWERLDLVTQKSEDKRACAFKPTDAQLKPH